MNFFELQSRLRQFAAERDWQPFHTPKNLSTALLVEAAELAEIFQWMTPEESRLTSSDAVQHERIGAEVADVLLYLVQLADHCGIDIEQAVDAKIVANARKYPGPRSAAALQRVEPQPAIRATHVLIDYENVQPTLGQIQAAAPGASSVWVFHGPHQKHVDTAYPAFGDRVTAVPISQTGKNALDFHLSYYLGYLASRNDRAEIIVMANDTGYEPMLVHARAMGIQVHRVPVLRPQPGKAAKPTSAPAIKPEAGRTPAPVRADGGPRAAAKSAAPVPAARQSVDQSPASPPLKLAASAKDAASGVAVKKSAAKKPAAKKTAAMKTAAGKAAATKVAVKSAAPVSKPGARKAPAKKAAIQKLPAKKVPATAVQVTTGVAVKQVNAAGLAVARAVAVMPTHLQHAIDSLRNMADKRPVRLTGLRGALKSLLGETATAATIEAAMRRLVELGYLDLAATPKVSFPKFADGKAAAA